MWRLDIISPPRSVGCPSMESNSWINVKHSATRTFLNKDVTSKFGVKRDFGDQLDKM